MKKTYIAPSASQLEAEIEALMDITSINSTQAGEGSEGNPVNYSRGNHSAWEDDDFDDDDF
ncbi:MAG: hypothetical protein IJP74_07655 [Prevotella sp.]|nr:hypothetical protein [Prevotella sp.]